MRPYSTRIPVEMRPLEADRPTGNSGGHAAFARNWLYESLVCLMRRVVMGYQVSCLWGFQYMIVDRTARVEGGFVAVSACLRLRFAKDESMAGWQYRPANFDGLGQ